MKEQSWHLLFRLIRGLVVIVEPLTAVCVTAALYVGMVREIEDLDLQVAPEIREITRWYLQLPCSLGDAVVWLGGGAIYWT